MITSLQIRNFRGLKDVTLNELRRVNLLVGGNDTGKTSILEAIVLLLGDASAISQLPTAFRNNQSGGTPSNGSDDRENFWAWLFYDRDPANSINIVAASGSTSKISISTKGGSTSPIIIRTDIPGERHVVEFQHSSVQVAGQSPPHGVRLAILSIRPPHPVQLAEKYNQVALESDGEIRFENMMREVEPRLKRLRYAKLPGTGSPLVFADIGLSRAVPSTQMGQAFNRLLHIYAEILTSKSNILLIDEIENGIFSESLSLIWKGLFAVCEQQNVQIFATTHSRECVMAAHAAAEGRGKDELSVQRLQIVKGNVEAVRLGKQHLEVAAEMGWRFVHDPADARAAKS